MHTHKFVGGVLCAAMVSTALAGCRNGPSDAEVAIGAACFYAGPVISEADKLLSADPIDVPALTRLVYTYQDTLADAASGTGAYEDVNLILVGSFRRAAAILPRAALWYAQEAFGAPFPTEDITDVLDGWSVITWSISGDCAYYPRVG